MMENIKQHSLYTHNLGWFYYRYYYKDLGKADANNDFSGKNQALINCSLSQEDVIELSNYHIEHTTIYPGLVFGTGITHQTGEKNENEFKLGLFFDHTTGNPMIPGSSVKGLLRSVFPNSIKKKKTDTEEVINNQRYREPRRKYILKILNELLAKPSEMIDINIDNLENEIFEGFTENGEEKTLIPIYQRDIFFDAYPVKVKNKFLGIDYITPHYNAKLKNPIPVQFLKIMPGVTFQFNFNLNNGLIKSQEKLALFNRILSDIGIGAKTNVGYGQFK